MIDGAEELGRIDTRRGELVLHSRGPLLLTRVEGHLESVAAPLFVRHADAMIEAHGSIQIFHDWAEMTGYDGSVRRSWTAWALRSLRGMPDVHFLVRSPLVKMGVSAAALATQMVGVRMRAHERREDFSAALQAALSAGR